MTAGAFDGEVGPRRARSRGGNELRKAPDLGPMVEQIYGKQAWEAIREGKVPFDSADD